MRSQHSKGLKLRGIKSLKQRRAAAKQDDSKAQKSLDETDEQKALKKVCHVCSAKASKTCGGCRSALYCSQECQISDWPEHKMQCRKNSEKKNSLQERGMLEIPSEAIVLAKIHMDDAAAVAAFSADEVNGVVNKGETYLMLALRFQRRKAFEALLKHPDIKIESTDPDGETALWHAVEQNDEDSVKLLLAHEASVCALDASVFEVSSNQRIKSMLKDALVEQLDEEHAHAKANRDLEAFLKTVNLSQLQLMSLFINLLKKKAVLRATSVFTFILSDHPDSALQLKKMLNEVCASLCKAAAREPLHALKTSCPNGYDLLTTLDSESGSLLFTFIRPENLIFAAIAVNNTELVQSILEYLADEAKSQINGSTTKNNNYLKDWQMPEEYKGFASVLTLCKDKSKAWYIAFLKEKPKEAQATKMIISPLLWAWLLDRPDVIKCCVGWPGFDLQALTSDNLPVWMYLVNSYHGNQEIMQLLRDRGYIDPNRLVDYSPVLVRACDYNFVHACEFLLAKKELVYKKSAYLAADVHSIISHKMSPSDIIRFCRMRPDVLNVKKLVGVATRVAEKSELFNELVKESIDFTLDELKSILAIGCGAGSLYAVKWVLEKKGVSVNSLLPYASKGVPLDTTAFSVAIHAGQTEIVIYLLENLDLNPEVKDSKGNDSFFYARECKDRSPEIFYILMGSQETSGGTELLRVKPLATADLGNDLDIGKRAYESGNCVRAFELFDNVYRKATLKSQKTTAAFYLGLLYYIGRGVQQDFAKAFILLQEGSHDVNNKVFYAHANVRLGDMHCNGQGTPVNYDLAFQCYKQAAARGESEINGTHAMIRMAEMFLKGQAPSSLFTVPYAKWTLAEGWVRLGELHASGKETPVNYEAALEYFLKGAEQDDNKEAQATACAFLGQMYYLGQGVTRDPAKARSYLVRAAGQDKNVLAKEQAVKLLKEIL